MKNKNVIKAFFKNATRAGKVKVPAIMMKSSIKRDIVNFTMLEKVIPVGIKSSIIQMFRKHTTYKVWYYVNKTPENPKGERKEHFISLPDAEKKPLGYIEKGTENIFLVNKNDTKTSIYSVTKGNVFPMKHITEKMTNQEVKQFLTG